MTPLRQRYLEDLQLRNYSVKTQQVYVECVSLFARHFHQSPERLGPEEIRAYQLYLIQEKQVSWSRFNQTVCALRFLYGTTLHKDWVVKHMLRAQILPVPARSPPAGPDSRHRIS